MFGHYLLDHFEPGRAVAQQPGLAPVPGRRVQTNKPTSLTNLLPQGLTAEEQVNVAVYEYANRGVVNINTKTVHYDSFFFGETPSEGAGSGSVLDKEGHILTNFHVVEGVQRIEVTLSSGKAYLAKLVGHGRVDDVAILKIDAPADELHPVKLGDSSSLRIGQKVYAIGNPFGLERTLTVGIVSSLNRTLPNRRNGRVMKSIIQVDAAMNPGNSGGPLLGSSGTIIGMSTAIASRTGQNTGVGFAIPVNRIKKIIPELIRHGRVIRPDTGITRVMETEKGLLVAAIETGGPAEKAGIRGFRIVREQRRDGPFVYESRTIDRSYADLIVAVDGSSIRTVDEFLTIIEQHKPNDVVRLTVIRKGQQFEVSVRLAADNGD